MRRHKHPLLAGAVLLLTAAASAGAADSALREVGITEVAEGTGTEIQRGWFAVMHYTGWVYDEAAPEHKGRQFVSSRERGQPTTFVYGHYRALVGLEKGMRGMKVGGRRTIAVPSKLGYDDLKYPTPKDVPPGSALVFDVELLDAVPQHGSN